MYGPKAPDVALYKSWEGYAPPFPQVTGQAFAIVC